MGERNGDGVRETMRRKKSKEGHTGKGKKKRGNLRRAGNRHNQGFETIVQKHTQKMLDLNRLVTDNVQGKVRK